MPRRFDRSHAAAGIGLPIPGVPLRFPAASGSC
jgi:hypothetical protein